MNYISEIQSAAEGYDCPWSDLPEGVRQMLMAEYLRAQPYLEPLEAIPQRTLDYLFREQLADAIRHKRRGKAPEAYLAAVQGFVEQLLSLLMAECERRAEDDYDAEFLQESTTLIRARAADVAAESRARLVDMQG